MLTLAGENLEKVPMVWPALDFVHLLQLRAVTFGLRVSDERPERAQVSIEGRRPVKPILFSRGTHKPLGKFQNLVSIVVSAGVFALRVHIGAHDWKCRELVLSDAAVQKFVLADVGVEKPTAICFHERNREWPQVIAQLENDESIRNVDEMIGRSER